MNACEVEHYVYRSRLTLLRFIKSVDWAAHSAGLPKHSNETRRRIAHIFWRPTFINHIFGYIEHYSPIAISNDLNSWSGFSISIIPTFSVETFRKRFLYGNTPINHMLLKRLMLSGCQIPSRATQKQRKQYLCRYPEHFFLVLEEISKLNFFWYR